MPREMPNMGDVDLDYAKKMMEKHDISKRVLGLKKKGESFESAFKMVMNSIGELENLKAKRIIFKIAESAWKNDENKPTFTEEQKKRMKRSAELQQAREERRAGQTYEESDLE